MKGNISKVLTAAAVAGLLAGTVTTQTAVAASKKDAKKTEKSHKCKGHKKDHKCKGEKKDGCNSKEGCHAEEEVDTETVE